VGSWYWIGLALGLGVACGTLAAALLGWNGRSLLVGVVAAIAGGIGLGLAIGDWPEAAAGGGGGLLGAAAAAPLVAATVRGGGTRAGTALIVAGAALVLAGLALVPAVGFVVAAAAPILAWRVRGRGGRRYAGLRILARD
jgi:hypothetical protein